MIRKLILAAILAMLCLGCASRDGWKENVYRGVYDGLTAQYPDKDTQVTGDLSHRQPRHSVSYDQYRTERDKRLQEDKN